MATIPPHKSVLQADEGKNCDKPPSSGNDFPTLAYGYGTSQYWQFLDALLDGLLEYEAKQGGQVHAPEPLPAA